MTINSQNYWNERFETNWLDFAGDKQTVFFARLLCGLLPDELAKEVMANEYTVCDMGCALGEGVPVYSSRLGVDVEGMDFSDEAIKRAREAYPNNKFWVGNLLDLSGVEPYDVVICSNVMEHFANPWKIFKNLAAVAKKYIIVMVPYREKLDIDEHEYHFSEDNIPVDLAGFHLQWVKTIDGKSFKDTYYPDQQVLLVYKKEPESLQLLNALTDGISEAALRGRQELEQKVAAAKDQEMADKQQAFEKRLRELEEQAEKQEKQNAAQLKNQAEEYEQNTRALTQAAQEAQAKLAELQQQHSEMQAALKNLQWESTEKEKAICRARQDCQRVNAKLSYKFLCVITRFVQQFIMGPWQQKKNFLSICKSFLLRKPDTFSRNDGYNFVLNISNLLDLPQTPQGQAAPAPENGAAGPAAKNEVILPGEIPALAEKCLDENYSKPDIIMFSVINYDFRYQRPQHFATRFANNGHRVFYINANFVNKEAVNQPREGLFAVDFFCDHCNAIYYATDCPDFESWFKAKMDQLIADYAIRDAIIVLDYPNWVHGAEDLRQRYGFKIVVDYMDDFTGFLGTTTDTLKDNCLHMLKTSDLIVASSQFLYDIASKYAKKLAIVRNGTEVEHFYQAVPMETHHKRPVIGYYGAVAHWFAWEKVCYLAKALPECDVVIIGEVTEHREELEKHKNIKLLGEKNYKELPKHLAYFDVCLIPFDTSTDLIKATNPVKFYEYLSAGKRIVATEIPELEPYRDQYVYMSNDDSQFLEYVKLCLAGKDTLKSKADAIAFAKENDWQKRYEAFAEASLSAFPKVSVVVLTYNNLALNKVCIESVLTKTAYPNYELIVLDNQSTDGTVDYLRQLEAQNRPHLKIIINEENSGFAGGNNKAIRTSDGTYVVLLNNDTVVTRGWLTNMVKHMENDPACGMCGAVTNSIGNEAMIGVHYKNLHELQNFAYLYTLRHNNEIFTRIDRLAMFCTMIRRSIMDEYGMLDQNYQVGMFEDDDYAKVIEKAGYQLYVAEDAFVHHVNNASFKKLKSEEYKQVFEKNKKLFEDKWSTKWKMPHYRDGVTADINNGMMVEPVE